MAQQYDDMEERRRRKKRREERRRRQRRQALIARGVVLVALLLILFMIIFVVGRLTKKGDSGSTQEAGTQNTTSEGGATNVTDGTADGTTSVGTETAETTAQTIVSTAAANADLSTKEGVLDYARLQAAQYDYDGAIATIQSFSGYESDSDLTAEINTITTAKNACTPVEVSTTPHVFFHSLINDYRGLIASETCTEERVQSG